jgi:hypothetical protein
MPPKKSPAAANSLRSPDHAATAPTGQTSHQSGGMFGSQQSIFTPQAPPQSDDSHGRTAIENLTSQLAALQDTVRALTEDKRQYSKPQFLTPHSPTSFLSFVQSSSPQQPSLEGLSSRLDGGARGGFHSSKGGSRGAHFSAGDLREILNPRKPVEEPRLLTVTVAAAVDFLTKWHEHGASVLGTSTATHLSLLINPPALQTIADKNDIAPDSIMSACNTDIITYLATAISFGKGPADAILSIASHCSLRRLTASAFASFFIRFEILCFLFTSTSIPDKSLAKAFCSSIQNTRASSHLSSLDCRDWRSLAHILKQAILQREALEPFFGPHRDPEVTSRSDGFREPLAVRQAPPSPQQVQGGHSPVNRFGPTPPMYNSKGELPQGERKGPDRRQDHQSGPPRQSAPPTPQQGSSTRFQPRSVAAASAHIDVAPDDPEVEESDQPLSDEFADE